MSLKSKIEQHVVNSFSGKEKVIFLDLCHWYLLLDDSKYENLKVALEKGVNNSDILCPVSYSILCEFRKNQDKALVLKRIGFADKLSKRLGFVHHYRVQKMEFFQYGLYQETLSKKDVLTHWLDLFPVPLNLKKNGASERECEELLNELINVSPIEWLKYDELWRFTNDMTERVFKPLANRINEYNNDTTRSNIFKDELQKVVLELLDAMSKDLSFTLSEIEDIRTKHYLKIENHRPMFKFFKNIPTVNIRSQINTSLRIDKHSVKPNDLWDFEHAVSLPYTDIYVTDKPSAHILKNVLKLDEKYGVEILHSLDELSQILGGLKVKDT